MAVLKKKTEITYKGKVHDLCVEDKHTYNVEGIAVHNSAAGCLISYCLEITKLDPLKYGLLFERFLDPGRSDPPDIDWDVDPRYRQQVKNQMANIFGEKNVCSVGSYQLIWTKTAIKDVGRVFGIDPGFLNGITKGLADSFMSNDAEAEESSIDKADWYDLVEQDPVISSLIKKYPYMSDPIRLVRGQIRNIGKHPAGMIVASVDLTRWIPLRTIGKEGEKEIVACWTEGLALKELQEIGLVKYDVLGLRTISIISDALDLIEETTIVINLEGNKKVRLKPDDIVQVDWEGETCETMAKDLEPGHVLIGVPDNALIL
jgi:DNA polymerase-3 subunit alpha